MCFIVTKPAETVDAASFLGADQPGSLLVGVPLDIRKTIQGEVEGGSLGLLAREQQPPETVPAEGAIGNHEVGFGAAERRNPEVLRPHHMFAKLGLVLPV